MGNEQAAAVFVPGRIKCRVIPAGQPIQAVRRGRARIQQGLCRGNTALKAAADALHVGEETIEEICRPRLFSIDRRQETRPGHAGIPGPERTQVGAEAAITRQSDAQLQVPADDPLQQQVPTASPGRDIRLCHGRPALARQFTAITVEIGLRLQCPAGIAGGKVCFPVAGPRFNQHGCARRDAGVEPQPVPDALRISAIERRRCQTGVGRIDQPPLRHRRYPERQRAAVINNGLAAPHQRPATKTAQRHHIGFIPRLPEPVDALQPHPPGLVAIGHRQQQFRIRDVNLSPSQRKGKAGDRPQQARLGSLGIQAEQLRGSSGGCVENDQRLTDCRQRRRRRQPRQGNAGNGCRLHDRTGVTAERLEQGRHLGGGGAGSWRHAVIQPEQRRRSGAITTIEQPDTATAISREIGDVGRKACRKQQRFGGTAANKIKAQDAIGPAHLCTKDRNQKVIAGDGKGPQRSRRRCRWGRIDKGAAPSPLPWNVSGIWPEGLGCFAIAHGLHPKGAAVIGNKVEIAKTVCDRPPPAGGVKEWFSRRRRQRYGAGSQGQQIAQPVPAGGAW